MYNARKNVCIKLEKKNPQMPDIWHEHYHKDTLLPNMNILLNIFRICMIVLTLSRQV